MTTREINVLLELRGDTLTSIANDIGENRTFLTDIINYRRPFNNPSVRRVIIKFALRLGMKVEQVFDGVQPATRKEINETLKALKGLGLAVTT